MATNSVVQRFRPNVSLKVIFFGFLICFIAVTLFFHSRPGQVLNQQVAVPLDFQLREFVGLSPELDSRLKILGFDDRTAAALRRPDLKLSHWTQLIEALIERKPRAIFIDKVFGHVVTETPGELAKFQTALAKAGNVHAIAFVHRFDIPHRERLNLSNPDYDLEKLSAGSMNHLDWLPVTPGETYGPRPDISGYFAGVGHAVYPGGGEIDPFVRVSENRVIPHLGMFLNKPWTFRESGVSLAGSELPLNAYGRYVVNFSSPRQYYSSAFSLADSLAAVQRGRKLSHIDAGDVVLILPEFYTGNNDVYQTPVGRLPGGFLQASVINSQLTQNHVRAFGSSVVVLAFFCAAATAFGLVAGPLVFWSGLLLTLGFIVGGGSSTFAYLNWQVAWLPAASGFALTGMFMHAIRMRDWVKRTRNLKESLKGIVPEAKLKDLISGKASVTREASERVVTLLFVDIAHFSVMAEQRSPKEVFLELKDILRMLTRIVHKHGGTVDKTLGDGMLCFFGYSVDGVVVENQADVAIDCAIEMQKENVRRCLMAARDGRPVLPLRIGINTGSVYIGDIGNEERFDFTVIGSGVNFAQRLESVCDPNSLMISGTTVDFSTRYNPRMQGFRKKFIHIKHHENLLEAIEYNPFHVDGSMLFEIAKLRRQGSNLERREQRWPVNQPERIVVDSDFGSSELVDFSTSGLCVRLRSFLSRGVKCTLRLRSEDGSLERRLASKGIEDLKCEVRWGKDEDGNYVHGLRFLNLGEAQSSYLFSALREVFTHQADASYIYDASA